MLEAINLHKKFKRGVLRKPIYAVKDISLRIHRGEAVGISGPSGSGKSTVARILGQILKPTKGSITLNGADTGSLSRRQIYRYHRKVQMIFQDPHLALDPKKTILWSMKEVLFAHKIVSSQREADEKIRDLFRETGLSPEIYDRYPYEISGGQAQRVVIARALSLSPEYLIADEPTSMLDLSVQAMILGLLKNLKCQRNLGIMLITHDPAMVRVFCDRTLFITNGSISKTL